MGLLIHPRSEWEFPGWAKNKDGVVQTPYSAKDSQRTEFFVHYEGGSPTKDTGAEAMQAIHRVHLNRGWSGVGYNFVIFPDGSVWEGRGWLLVGAHCPQHNTSGVGVQIHIGGNQEPSVAALRACRELYDEACRRSGRTLLKRGHRDGIATECPGDVLYSWVQTGMPAPAPEITQEDSMGVYVEPEGQLPGDGVYWVSGEGVHGVDAIRWAILKAHDGARAVTVSRVQYIALVGQVVKQVPPIDISALAAEIVKHIPAGALTAAAVADEIAARLAA
jgi:hypothetical protein